MIKNRKKTETLCLKYIEKLAGKDNLKLYQDFFKSLNNNEFFNFMSDLKDNKITLSIIIPNGGVKTLDTGKNLKLCKELGFEPFQRTVELIPGTNVETLSSVKSLCLYLPYKRLSQHMKKGISFAENLKSRNHLTGQVSGSSRSAKITSKELGIFLGKGYTSAMDELMVARSGDLSATNAMNAFIDKYGEVSLEDVKRYSQTSQSTKTLDSYFKAMHLKTNLIS